MEIPSELLNIKLPRTFSSIPFGMHVIGNLPEKLILLTWNHDTIITYIFRDVCVDFLTKSLDNFNLLEPNEVHEIKNFLEPNETIANVFDTLVNTLLLTSFGRLFLFVSTKNIRKLDLSTSNKTVVQNLGYTTTGIYLIENRNANELFIKFYSHDLLQSSNCEIGGDSETIEFNLNIDDNLKFNISRLDETSCIKVFKFDEGLRNILEGLIGVRLDDSITYTEVVLFSIESNLFWLNTYSADNLIQQLNVSSSKITDFAYSKAQNFIICLLESGVVEILYFLTKFNMINKFYHVLGVQLNCHKFIDANNLIYSNNGRNLFQLSFYNDKKDCDGIDIETKTINVFGTQGITYNEVLKQIFVITNNFQLFNINYSTNYFQLTQNTNNDTNFNLNEIKNFSKILFLKSETIKKLEAQKNLEIDKIHLLDLLKLMKSEKTNRIHDSNTARINLIYRQNSVLQFVCTFNVHLKIVEHAKQFKILIEFWQFDRNAVHMLDVENRVTFKKSIDFEIDRQNCDFILPKFKIYLISRISMAADSIVYEFPIQVLNNYYDDINRNYFYLNYNRIAGDDTNAISKKGIPIIYNFRIQNVGMNLEKLIRLLDFEYEDGYCEYLFLNQYRFKIKYTDGLVTIEAECPQTLHCIKYYILKKLKPSVVFKEDVVDSVQKLKYALPEDDQITNESQTELQTILQNLRTEFVPTFKIPE